MPRANGRKRSTRSSQRWKMGTGLFSDSQLENRPVPIFHFPKSGMSPFSAVVGWGDAQALQEGAAQVLFLAESAARPHLLEREARFLEQAPRGVDPGQCDVFGRRRADLRRKAAREMTR